MSDQKSCVPRGRGESPLLFFLSLPSYYLVSDMGTTVGSAQHSIVTKSPSFWGQRLKGEPQGRKGMGKC